MKNRYVLIDYENVHNIDLKPLLNQNIHIVVFHSEDQKFSSDFTTPAIDLGKEKIELVKMKGHGKNALDFHIAFFLGKLSKDQKGQEFYIISKDTGFEPLLSYLNEIEKIPAYMNSSIADLPILNHNQPQKKDRYSLVTKMLSDPAKQKPKSFNALKHEIISLYGKKIDEIQAENIVFKLIAEKIIERDGDRIIYIT